MIRDLGRTVGRINQALAGYDHSAFHYTFDWDLAQAIDVVRRYRDLISDTQLRDSVNQIYRDFENIVVPRFDQLRKSVIHNDANDYNVLAEGDNVTGLIDFGDMVYSYTICDLAIAMAYAALESDDVRQVIKEMALVHRIHANRRGRTHCAVPDDADAPCSQRQHCGPSNALTP